MDGPRPAARALGSTLVLLGLAGLWLSIARFDFVCDDAYISFRYARHLAQGLGLRFNLGEEPPVEGYSNLGWVLWCALAEARGIDVTLWARASSGACAAASVLVVTAIAWRRAGALAGGLSALLLGTFPAFGAWASGGLETAAFTLAVVLLGASLALDPERPRALPTSLAVLAALLLRTDGALWVVAVVGAWALAEGGPLRARLRGARAPLVALVAGLALQLGFRLAYHGDFLSQTARVKGGLSALRLERGLRYDASQILAQPSLSVALAIVVVASVYARHPTRTFARTGALLFGFALAYAALVGGDFMALARLFVPALPALALGCGAALSALATRRAAAALVLTAGTLALSIGAGFDLVPVPRALRERLHFRWNSPSWESEIETWRAMRDRARIWAVHGQALAVYTRRGESILGTAIGALSYPNEIFVYDLFGLVSPEVARATLPHRRMSPGHDRYVDPEFFFGRRPTYFGSALVPANAPRGTGLPPDFESSPLSAMITVERHPLDPAEGFPPDLELRLFRMRW